MISDDSPRSRSPFGLAWLRFRRSKTALAGLTIVGLLALVAVFASWLAPFPYDEPFDDDLGKGPSLKHWLGVDELGRDILSRIIFGARVSFQIGFAATAVSLLIGVALGTLAGFYSGWVDAVLMRLTDTFYAFPGILLAIGITAAFDEPSIIIVFIALGLVGWTGIARIVRGEVLKLREMEYVQAARAVGGRDAGIIFRHILPNCIGPVVVVATLRVASNILAEAGLSFLGIGVQPPQPSWGGMLASARDYLIAHWWMCFFPGLAIMVTVLGFNLLGDGLRDALDPKMRV